MSDEIKTGGEDPIQQVKGEFTRKLSNTEAQITELKKANEAMLAQLKKLTTPPPAPKTESEDVEDILYRDPKRYTEIVERRAEERVMSKLRAEQAVQQKQSTVLSSLINEFPELSNNDHELTKKAIELYNNLPDDDKTSPMAYRLAVKEAAMELGVKPRSKRAEDDSYSFGGSSGGTSSRKKKETLDSSTLDFAKIMGLDTSDPKVKERLAARAARDWKRPKGIQE